MLVWLCALHCEAKPLIDNYRLQKSTGVSPFDWYQSEDMTCVVSGMGKIAAAAAVASTAEKLGTQCSLAWINLGIAGTAEEPLGRAFQINKCTDLDSGQSVYPAIIGQSRLPTRPCITSAVAVDDYQGNNLHDMEASGFFQAAQYYSTSELVHAVKVVSDNRNEKTGKNRQRTSELIADNMQTIGQQAEKLIELNQQQAARQPDPISLGSFLELAHFSETRKHQLSSLLNYLLNRGFDANNLLGQCQGKPASQIIVHLQQLGQADSRNL